MIIIHSKICIPIKMKKYTGGETIIQLLIREQSVCGRFIIMEEAKGNSFTELRN